MDAVLAAESSFDLAPQAGASKESFELAAQRRHCILYRLDGGFGSDEKLAWLLARGYQIIVKGFSGRRAGHLAEQVKRWNRYGDAWLGAVTFPIDLGRPVQAWVKRRMEKEALVHSYYLTTLQLHSLAAYMDAYDQRGATEIEQFRKDKQGLALSFRRKHGRLAQKALVLAVDIAHNLLAHFHAHALVNSPFADFAAKRIVRDLLAIEGNLIWDNQELVRVELASSNHYAKPLSDCLRRYFLHGHTCH